MKKTLHILAGVLLCSLATLLTISCQKNNEFGPKEEPALRQSAMLLTLEENIHNLKTIEFTDAGRFILKREHMLPPYASAPATKAESSSYYYQAGTYTFQSGTYVLNGFGTVTVKDGTVTISADGEKEYSVNASITYPGELSSLESKLCRTWRVERTTLAFGRKGEENAITHKFDGCNLYDIAKYGAQYGIEYLERHLEDFVGYKVEDITLSSLNSICIRFSNRDPFVGEWKHDEQSMSYSLDHVGNALIKTNAEGQFDFVEDGILELNIKIDLSTQDQDYKGNLIFRLSETD